LAAIRIRDPDTDPIQIATLVRHAYGALSEVCTVPVLLHCESKKGCDPNHGYNFVNS